MQFPGSVTQPKTILPHSCPMASFTFLPLGQGLTSSNHMKPAESPRGFQASFQLNLPHNGLGMSFYRHIAPPYWKGTQNNLSICQEKQLPVSDRGHLAQKQQEELLLPQDRVKSAPAYRHSTWVLEFGKQSWGILKQLVYGMKFLQNNKWSMAS